MSEQIHVVLTEDGSPTAYFNDFESEKMHHTGGAFSESVYIYGPAIQWAFAKEIVKPKIISAGTGLAYNEMITAAMALIFESDFILHSFEKNKLLNQSLIAWLTDSSEKTIVEKSVYDVILQKTAQCFDLAPEKIKSCLKGKFENRDWQINEELPENFQEKYNVIIYDLFSSKAMENFWSEEYLTKFFKETSADLCAFGTYACTGSLKRALRNSGFEFVQRTGYMWKRHSSFAFKK